MVLHCTHLSLWTMFTSVTVNDTGHICHCERWCCIVHICHCEQCIYLSLWTILDTSVSVNDGVALYTFVTVNNTKHICHCEQWCCTIHMCCCERYWTHLSLWTMLLHCTHVTVNNTEHICHCEWWCCTVYMHAQLTCAYVSSTFSALTL